MTEAYHLGARVTPANAVTMGRLVLSIPWLFLVREDGASWLTFGLGFILAVSDFIDGWLARRQGVTNAGAFLDPLADKVLVLGGMWALVLRSRFDVLPVVLITLREVVISVWRSRLGRQGVSVPARQMAKWKTFIQQLAIGLALLPVLAGEADIVADVMLWVAVVLTLWSGARYLADGSVAMRSGGASA